MTRRIQATDDRVVEPESAQLIYDRLGARHKALHWVESQRHGILHEDLGGAQQMVIDAVERLAATSVTRWRASPSEARA